MNNQKYKRKTAGRVAINNIPIFFEQDEIEIVREVFLRDIKKYETINYLYVIDKEKTLKGVISIKLILDIDIVGPLFKYMDKDLIKVRANTNQERVANLAIKNNLKSIPVVDKDDKFLGIVTSDTILNILQEEHTEDVLIAGGYLIDDSIKNFEDSSLKQLVLLRSPWLIIGLFGGIVAAKFIEIFESTISSLIILSFFIPVIVYLSGAVSTQSATIFIRGIAINNKLPVYKYFFKEVKIGIILGILLGFMISFVSYIGWNDFRLSLILFLSVFFGIIFSIIFAILTPLFLWKIKKDPAIGTSPLVTITSDFLSIVIYLSIAKLLIFLI